MPSIHDAAPLFASALVASLAVAGALHVDGDAGGVGRDAYAQLVRREADLPPANSVDAGVDDDPYRQRGVWPPISTEGFAALAPTREQWCPWCDDDELCQRQFLFIIGVGRSGSTTLMNMVNFLPGITIWGESKLIPRYLMQMQKSMDAAWNRTIGGDMLGMSGAMSHNVENLTSFRADAQSMIWDMFAPPPRRGADSTVRGFNDIAWTRDNLNWALSICPCSRFIVSYRRDVAAQAKSGFWAIQSRKWHDTTGSMTFEKVKNKTRMYRGFADTLGDRSFQIALEDFGIQEFDRLAAWLGSPCRFNHLVHVNPNGTLKIPPHRCEDCVRCPHPGSGGPPHGEEEGPRGVDTAGSDGRSGGDGDDGGKSRGVDDFGETDDGDSAVPEQVG